MENKRLVKIKTWEQMEGEFGLDEDGDIYKQNVFVFTNIMEGLLPKNRIIKIEYSIDYDEYIWKCQDYSYYIKNDMIEEALNPENYPQYLI